MKTKQEWNASGKDLSEYLGAEPYPIDEELYNYLAECVTPQYSWTIESGALVCQIGKVSSCDSDGIFHYATAMKCGDDYYFIGNLPEFKQ